VCSADGDLRDKLYKHCSTLDRTGCGTLEPAAFLAAALATLGADLVAVGIHADELAWLHSCFDSDGSRARARGRAHKFDNEFIDYEEVRPHQHHAQLAGRAARRPM
jgi:hypothetical protein